MIQEVGSEAFAISLGDWYRAFLIDDDVPTLIDTGLEETLAELQAAIDSIGIDPERVVITHGDGDHINGLEGVLEAYNVETWVPERTAIDADITPDYRYEDGDEIGSFEAVHVPGHTDDNHALIDESRGIAVMGDAIVNADQRGLPAGYPHLPPGKFTDDLNEAEANLEGLLEYEFDTALVFHGSPVVDDAHAKLDRFINFRQ